MDAAEAAPASRIIIGTRTLDQSEHALGSSAALRYELPWPLGLSNARERTIPFLERQKLLTVPEALTLAHQASQAGQTARACHIYQTILETLPDEPNALGGLGTALYQLGKLDEAENNLRRAITICPREASLHNTLYLVMRAQGRVIEAIDCCRRALALAPNVPELHNNLGTALKAAGQLEEAADSFRAAIALRGDYADAHYNLANTLVKLKRLDESEAAYRRAMNLAPRDSQTHNNFGTLMRLRGRLDEAAEAFKMALRCESDSAEAHHNRAVLWLLLGDFERGWPEYEWRWRVPGAVRPQFAAPTWRGEPPRGRTILLWAEQGLGDSIQFIRYAEVLKNAGARVIVDCPPRLHALLATANGIDRFGGASEEPIDFQVSLVSVPGVCRVWAEATAPLVPYLRAESVRVEHWRRRLADIEGFKVGIAWQGSAGYAGDAWRSVPLAEFGPVAAVDGVRLVSLQKGFGSEQLATLGERWNIVDLAKSLDEEGHAFIDTAAAMSSLDLVITSDTAIAHLAGALGVRVWVVLQQTPNWRWMVDRADSPWYPTMRLFRQKRLGEWAAPFSQMAAEMAKLRAQNGR